MPEGSLAAAVIGMAGIEIVIEQRPAAAQRFKAGVICAKRNRLAREPFVRDLHQQPLPGAVVLSFDVFERRDIHFFIAEFIARQTGAL
ncbi:hypothetical protein D3C75_803780 [compost metagenome]